MKEKKHNLLTDAQQARRDNLLTSYLFDHKGAENAVTKHEVARYLEEQGYPQKVGCVGELIRRIAVQRHLPICAKNARGYFWAASKDDLQAYIADLERRAAALTKHANRLKSFIFE